MSEITDYDPNNPYHHRILEKDNARKKRAWPKREPGRYAGSKTVRGKTVGRKRKYEDRLGR